MNNEVVKKILLLADNLIVKENETIHFSLDNNVLSFTYFPECFESFFSFCCDIIDFQMTIELISGYEVGGNKPIKIYQKDEIIKLINQIDEVKEYLSEN